MLCFSGGVLCLWYSVLFSRDASHSLKKPTLRSRFLLSVVRARLYYSSCNRTAHIQYMELGCTTYDTLVSTLTCGCVAAHIGLHIGARSSDERYSATAHLRVGVWCMHARGWRSDSAAGVGVALWLQCCSVAGAATGASAVPSSILAPHCYSHPAAAVRRDRAVRSSFIRSP